jgi:hypothetical protein
MADLLSGTRWKPLYPTPARTPNRHVRRTPVRESLLHRAALARQPEFQALTAEFRSYVTNLDIDIWGPSPLVPEPLRRE